MTIIYHRFQSIASALDQDPRSQKMAVQDMLGIYGCARAKFAHKAKQDLTNAKSGV